MASVIQPVDAYAEFNSLVNQKLGIDGVTDGTINFVGIGEAIADADSQTSAIITSALQTLVTHQEILPLVYKSAGVDIVASRAPYSQTVGYLQRSRPNLKQLESGADAYNPEPGSSSDPFKNYPVEMETNYFYKPFQAMIAYSIADRWATGLFLGERGVTEFKNAIRSAVEFQVRAALDSATFAAIRGSIALNLNHTTPLAKNVLALFNEETGTSLLAKDMVNSPDFLRFTAREMKNLINDMKETKVQFNEKGYPNHTDFDSARVLILSRLESAWETNLQSDTFHKELVALPNHSVVSSWKGPSLTAGGPITFESTSKVVDTFNFSNVEGAEPVSVDQDGVFAHIFSAKRVQIEDLGDHSEQMRDPVGLKTNTFLHLSGRVLVDDYENGYTLYGADA